jgi:hypothetical protein
VIRPVWGRLEEGSQGIYTAIIDTMFVGIDDNEKATPVSVMNSYPNPFRESTWIAFKTTDPAPVSLSVYDQMGRQVGVILDKAFLPAGKHIYQFDASAKNLSSGVYYFRLVVQDKVRMQKIVLDRE